MLDEIKKEISKIGLRSIAETDEKAFRTILGCLFKNRSKCHNWENYVDQFYKKSWKKLSKETRLVIFGMAYLQADSEEWAD